MSAHTPGPWSVKKFRTSVDDHEVIGADGKVICIGPYDRPLDDQERIDFRLISAAPDLLAALKSVLTQFEIVLPSSGLTHDERQSIIDARAAIAKAIGDTK